MTDSRLVLVFDDGYAEDYEAVAPVLREAGVPACFAVVPGWLGDEGHLTEQQAAELAAGGHELVAHGRCHRYLQAHRVTADAVPGDERISVSGPVYPDGDAGVRPGDRYEVTDGERTAERELSATGESEGTGYVEFVEPLDEAFAAGETVVRPTEAVLRDEILGVRTDFRDLGHDPETFAFPYDAADPRAWTAAREAYAAVANAATRSLPNPPGTPPTEYRRYYLETDSLTRADIAAYLDALAGQGGVGVLAGHSAWETVPPERVAWVCEAALERGIEVTTFRNRGAE